MKQVISFLILFFSFAGDFYSQQIDVTRIQQMPNKPVPYLMRNWKVTALGYDSLVFNFNLTGQYLPLISEYSNTINYPNHPSIKLHTVVGTRYPGSSEAINLLPAIIGATLCGVDKSSHNGRNLVLMAEEYFNKANGELVYLNHPNSESGNDWWYDLMPNIFFYQLNYLYPHTGDFDTQFVKVPFRWWEAVQKMGGSTTPWQIPNMNHRGWKLRSMTPNSSGVPEPEAAGTLAWIFYNAFIQTDNINYRIAAELALEFLNSLSTNPSYELQLPYGVYTAARMNAQIGTNYNIEKMVNWCFDVGPLRNWGAIIGNWGGYGVSGLIGENSNNDYAFAMNTFELAGSLVPMVRYDDRFARAIGKWVLNAANAARLFYSNYLPDNNQDNKEWAQQYDPHSYISYEALKENVNGVSPYATGDAIAGGWGYTNLALYGASHVGIFGSIIDTTNIEGILKLDLLKTDYYRDAAYPTFLFYNPYSDDRSVQLNTGAGNHNIYNSVSNAFVQYNVTGNINITVPGNSAFIAVITPAAGILSYKFNTTFFNEIAIDYQSGLTITNYPPRIKSFSSDKYVIPVNGSAHIYCTAEDKEGDSLLYAWFAEDGTIIGEGSDVTYFASSFQGSKDVKCIISDNNGGEDTALIMIKVISSTEIIERGTGIIPSDILLQNYPNPFNPSTEISFGIKENSFVKILIYNSIGQLVKELVNDNLSSGYYKISWNPGNSAVGIYFCRMLTSNSSITKKMALLR